MSRPLKIGLMIASVLWRSSSDLQFERISSRLSVVIIKADYSGINVPLVAVCNVPPVARCNVPPQKWLQ